MNTNFIIFNIIFIFIFTIICRYSVFSSITGPYVDTTCIDACMALKSLSVCKCRPEYMSLFNVDDSTIEDYPYCHSMDNVTNFANISASFLRTIVDESRSRTQCVIGKNRC